MKLRRIFSMMAIFSAMTVCYGGKITPVKDNGVIELFNAKRDKATVFTSRNCRWVKGNLKPVISEINNKDGKWLKFAYSGSKGQAQSFIVLTPRSLSKILPSDNVYIGAKIGIFYPDNNFKKIKINFRFSDKTILVNHLALKQGYHEYLINSGYRRAKFPPKWELLSMVDFVMKSPNPVKAEFLLKKIIISCKKMEFQKKILKISKIKKVREIFKSAIPVFQNNKIVQGLWDKATPLKSYIYYKSRKTIPTSNSPLQVRLSYDDKYLYVGSKTVFPNAAPVNHTVKGASIEKLWADELLEYFFSGENNNQKKIQFVTNLNGAVWDSVVEFDVVAATVIRRTNKWSLKHHKKLSFKNKQWVTDAVFPLSAIKVNLKKERFMGFQIAQNFSNSSKTLSWSKTKKFTNPRNFGVLVFNKKAFEKGEIFIKQIESKGVANGDYIDMNIELDTKDFIPGKYKYSVKIAQSDHTIINDCGNLELGKNAQKKNIKRILRGLI